MESRSRRAGNVRRIAVMETVAFVLAERGYDKTRFKDVSIASGVAVSTLQSYFGSREDMLIESMRHATEREVLALEAAADSDVDPWNRLIAMIDRNLNSPIRSHRLTIEFWRAGMRDPELRDYAHEGWGRYRAPFMRMIVEGRDAGFFAPTISPDDVVDLLLASLSGRMITRVLVLATPSADSFRNALLRQLAEVLGRAGGGDATFH
jgi:AcrR family transcriptional regulator